MQTDYSIRTEIQQPMTYQSPGAILGLELKDTHTHTDPTIETLRTPPVKITPASLARRAIANALDSLIITLLWLTVVLVQQLSPSQFSAANEGYLMVTTFVYFFVLEGLFASTIGKRLLHLSVVDRSGDPCNFTSSFLRNVFRFVDWFPFLYILGLALALTSNDRLRLGDRFARTIVTPSSKKDINPPPAPFLFH